MTKDELIQAVESMSVLELAELVKALEERFGVSAAAPVMMAAGAPAAAAEEVEEKTEFDVVLQDVGDKKIQVIKVVRQLTSLGLKEAKDMVESAPAKLMEAVTKEEAEKAKAALEAEGAKIELQ
ncbi:MAG: 50S ribosomal protein L7/L12 [Anaerolineae bacterium]|nr:50S ribosomal protein L7/L12 [Anaerolineae bacterium]